MSHHAGLAPQWERRGMVDQATRDEAGKFLDVMLRDACRCLDSHVPVPELGRWSGPGRSRVAASGPVFLAAWMPAAWGQARGCGPRYSAAECYNLPWEFPQLLFSVVDG